MQNLNIKQQWNLSAIIALVLVVCIQNTAIAAAKKIYWSEWGFISRANLDGSNVEDVIKGLDYAQDISLDFQNNTIFWIEEDIAKYKDVVVGYNKIMRANSDGTKTEEIFGGYHLPPEGGSAGKDCIGDVCRGWIHPEGGDSVAIDPELLFLPRCIALDNQKNQIYWVDVAHRKYRRSNLDGTDVIQQANLNGSNVRDVVTGLHNINGLALNSEGIYAVDPAGKLTTIWADVKAD